MNLASKPRILIVDDHPTNIKVLSDLLIDYGYEVLIAKDGENALQKLQRVTPDLILLDVLMPGIDGFETCRLLKASPKTEEIPVIFMTALSDAVDKIKGLTLGAVDYVTKPLQHEEVIARINVHLRLRSLTKQLEEQNAVLQQEVRSRKLAETALRASEEKFSKAFRSSPGPMMIASLSDERFIEVNQNFCQITHYAQEEIRGRTAAELDLWVDPAAGASFFQTLRTAGIVTKQELEIRTKSAEIRTLEVSAEVIQVGDLPCVLAMTYDITYCKQSAAELRQKEQFLRSIYEGMGLPLFIVNVLENGEFRSGGMNPAQERVMGIKSEEIQGRRYEELVPLEVVATWYKNYETCIAAGETIVYEEFVPFQGKDYWWLTTLTPLRNDQGRIHQIVGTYLNITDRKRVEAALRQSEARYRAIVQDQTELIVRFQPDGTITFVNDAYCRYFQQPREALLGHPLQSLFGEDWLKLSNLLNSLTPEQPVATMDNQIRVAGEVLWTQWVNRMVTDEQGNFLEFQSVGRDISDRKRMEAELQHAKEAADAVNRAKSTFLANMSHELRTPLHAILGFTELLALEEDLSGFQRESLEIINHSGEHLLGLINDVLEVSKIEAGKAVVNLGRVDLPHLLKNLEELMQLRASAKGLQLVFDLAPDLPRLVQTDENKLRQILLNLLSNAIKFTPSGRVTLRVGMAAIAPAERPTDSEGGAVSHFSHHLLIEVADTGLGIASAELERLFEAFFQTETGRQSRKGTGLGLFISRQLVQLLGGEITVASSVGQGTCFNFYIGVNVLSEPIDVGYLPIGSARRRLVGLEPNQPTWRILVVEDMVENRQLLVQLLSKMGFAVQSAENGQEAIALWQNWNPHLILMDMRLPIMDGYETTRQIKSTARGWKTVVIAVTASVLQEERTAIFAAGCDDLLCKPFKEQALFTKLAEHLGIRYLYEE
ncbi:MAG TPA: response regulator [Coleofasciculaceae cyanobacterium]